MIEQASENELKTLCGDKGYDSEKLRLKIRESGMRPVIPKRGNSLQSLDFCHAICKQRNLIERFIGELKENRRMATRYDKTASSYEAFIHWAAIENRLKIIC
ncbi:transposase [Desulfovibrio sp. SGI.169]|uniref:transposase n=1 Tax=Desulfovibrio sp. SGI.169 TaxID=3420561 RepID=UPI003CFC1EDD